jgi:tRNA-specific 2-thiouridylase
MRIVVAMSGGVDSSVAAALLTDAGHEAIGLSMQLYDQRDGSGAASLESDGDIRFGTCCTIDDLHDARRVAAAIKIPHYIVNFERQFDTHVVSNFVREYASGRTPIPCVHCNGDLKFATLVERAAGLDSHFVATGHYARVAFDEDRRRHLLKRGADPAKDQSYFLFTLTQEQLSRALFPVGHLTKTAVREYARERQLPVADKPDSHEICFVASGDHADFVARRAPGLATTGLIRDAEGRVLGRHEGVHRFTVGQRKGLRLSSHAPLYVLEIRPQDSAIVVGPREALERATLTASNVNWIACDPPASRIGVTAQIRHRHREAPARVHALDGGRAALEFDTPQTAITPGQAVVFYDGDVVVGGGWID